MVQRRTLEMPNAGAKEVSLEEFVALRAALEAETVGEVRTDPAYADKVDRALGTRCFIAKIDGEPVSGCVLWVHGSDAQIDAVATRRRLGGKVPRPQRSPPRRRRRAYRASRGSTCTRSRTPGLSRSTGEAASTTSDRSSTSTAESYAVLAAWTTASIAVVRSAGVSASTTTTQFASRTDQPATD